MNEFKRVFLYAFKHKMYNQVLEVAFDDFTCVTSIQPAEWMEKHQNNRRKKVDQLGKITELHQSLYQVLYKKRIQRYIDDLDRVRHFYDNRGVVIPPSPTINSWPVLSL